MNSSKKIALRVIILAGILGISSLVYERYFYQDFLEKEGLLLYRLNRSLNADYLFFSASSDYTFDPVNDTDTTRVSILTMNFCNKSIKSIADGAHHVGVFKELTKHIPENSIEGIIVAMNLRSFSPGWLTDENENALQKFSAVYKPLPPLISRLNVALNNYDQYTKHELKKKQTSYFDSWKLPYPEPKNSITNWCAVEKYGDWKNPKRQLADHYIKNYAFVINDRHQRIQEFDEVVQLAKSKKLNLIFHILPENTDEADSLIGKDLIALMDSNRDFLMNRYHKPKQKVWVIDNLKSVRHKDFTDRDFPTEHYNQYGRAIIAQSIAKQLNELK